jgi:DNA-binding MarR family transcriptional regulator
MAPDARRRAAERVATGLRRFVQALQRSSIAAERSTGLSGAQLYVLWHLERAPATSLEELARRTMTHPSSVSVVVSRLASQGLVRRSRSRSDRRRTELTATARGTALSAKAPETFQERLFAALDALPSKRLDELASGWSALEAELGLDRTPAPLFLEARRSGGGRQG